MKNGINDLINLTSKIKTHEKSMTHINCQLNLKLLGKQDKDNNFLVHIGWISNNTMKK